MGGIRVEYYATSDATKVVFDIVNIRLHTVLIFAVSKPFVGTIQQMYGYHKKNTTLVTFPT